MFDRFEEETKQVMRLAREQAQRLAHACLEAEHILLGLLDLPSCRGARALGALEIDPGALRARVLESFPSVTTRTPHWALPFAPAAKRVLELASQEAETHASQGIGTEHLLLAYSVLVEQGGARISADVLGVEPAKLRSVLADLPDAPLGSLEWTTESPTAKRLEAIGTLCQAIKEELVREQRFDAAVRLHAFTMELAKLVRELSAPGK